MSYLVPADRNIIYGGEVLPSHETWRRYSTVCSLQSLNEKWAPSRNTVVSTPPSAEEPAVRSAAEIVCGRRAARPAATDICHGLLPTPCDCVPVKALCARKLGRLPPRTAVSYAQPRPRIEHNQSEFQS